MRTNALTRVRVRQLAEITLDTLDFDTRRRHLGFETLHLRQVRRDRVGDGIGEELVGRLRGDLAGQRDDRDNPLGGGGGRPTVLILLRPPEQDAGERDGRQAESHGERRSRRRAAMRVGQVVSRRRRSQPAQIDRHLFRRLVAALGVALETLRDDSLELRIQARLQLGRWRERRVQDRVGQPPGLRVVERPPAGRHLVEHDPERVDVRPRVNRFTTHLLGCHVRERSLEPALRPRRRLVDVGGGARQLRQAEVQYFHPALGRDDDVGGLEIAVHDAALVRLLERRRHVAAECRDLLLRQRAAGDVLRQRLARHVPHDQEVDPVAAVEIVNRGDVRVVQPGQRLRFTSGTGVVPSRRPGCPAAAP